MKNWMKHNFIICNIEQPRYIPLQTSRNWCVRTLFYIRAIKWMFTSRKVFLNMVSVSGSFKKSLTLTCENREISIHAFSLGKFFLYVYLYGESRCSNAKFIPDRFRHPIKHMAFWPTLMFMAKGEKEEIFGLFFEKFQECRRHCVESASGGRGSLRRLNWQWSSVKFIRILYTLYNLAIL